MEHLKELLDALEGMHGEATERELEADARMIEANKDRLFWSKRREKLWDAHQGLVSLMNEFAKLEGTT